MADSEIANEPVAKKKKGVKNVTYKSEKIKAARLKNEPYLNHKGNPVNPKQQGYDCRCVKHDE